MRGAGNAYLTQFVNTSVDVARCEARSEASPGPCRLVPNTPGRYRAPAQVRETVGRTHTTQIGAWVRGKGRVVWNTSNDDMLDIVPEQISYAVGDTAHYLVQNPYPGARALVTIERYGVLKQWVKTLDVTIFRIGPPRVILPPGTPRKAPPEQTPLSALARLTILMLGTFFVLRTTVPPPSAFPATPPAIDWNPRWDATPPRT